MTDTDPATDRPEATWFQDPDAYDTWTFRVGNWKIVDYGRDTGNPGKWEVYCGGSGAFFGPDVEVIVFDDHATFRGEQDSRGYEGPSPLPVNVPWGILREMVRLHDRPCEAVARVQAQTEEPS